MAGRKYEPDRKRVRKDTQVVISVSPNEKEQIEQEAKNLLMSILGDNEVGTVTDGEGKVHKVTWKSQTRESISVAKLKKQDPASYEALKAIGLITTTSTRVMRI